MSMNYLPYVSRGVFGNKGTPLSKAKQANLAASWGIFATIADTTAPNVTAFVIPSTYDSFTIPITTFTATDNVGVTGYLVTQTPTAPTTSTLGWSSTPQTSYTFDTFSSTGSYTLYAWARDGAGNISTSLSATITDTAAPAPIPIQAVASVSDYILAKNTLLLDQLAWDLVADSSGNIAMATPPYALSQDIASAVRLFLGELWYDTTQGVPYWTDVLGHFPPASLLIEYIEDAALNVPGVISAQCVIETFTGREVTGQINFIDENGAANGVNF